MREREVGIEGAGSGIEYPPCPPTIKIKLYTFKQEKGKSTYRGLTRDPRFEKSILKFIGMNKSARQKKGNQHMI